MTPSMPVSPSPGAASYDSRVQPDRIHGSLYSDPAVFADEMRRIFLDGWVFVGHESEVPDPGDWVTRRLGLEPVIMVRGRDGRVRVLANRCAHRGTALCWQARGHDRAFRCAYHGWVFGLDGALAGVPSPGGETRPREALGLDRPGQTDTYRGFVFANQSGNAGTLAAHLGAGGRELIDRAVEMSPAGALRISGGWLGQEVRSNWKMWPESDNDGYHLGVAHASLVKAIPGSQYEAAAIAPESETRSLTRDHGQGHIELEFRLGYDRELAWLGTRREKVPEYCEALRAAYGDEKCDRILWDGPPHALIFPNLFIGEMNLAIIQPLGPDRMIHYHTALMLEGVTDALNRRILHQSEAAMGPASFFLPDDAVIAERMQSAFGAGHQDDHGWVDLSRGLDREQDENGSRIGHVSDETTNRGFWRHYLKVMTAAP